MSDQVATSGADAALEDDETPAGPIDHAEAFRNIVQLLQTAPQRYRLFGVWWWPIKALLRRAGYGPANLYLLGTYQDPETAAMVPRAGLDDTLRAAFEEYRFNASMGHPDGRVENPDGELVAIVDQDASL